MKKSLVAIVSCFALVGCLGLFACSSSDESSEQADSDTTTEESDDENENTETDDESTEQSDEVVAKDAITEDDIDEDMQSIIDDALKDDSMADPIEIDDPAKIDVSIDGTELAEDVDGNECIVATYTYTNDSDQELSFAEAIATVAVQGDTWLVPATTEDLEDQTATDEKVSGGDSATVKCAYEMNDDQDVALFIYVNDEDHQLVNANTYSIEEKK